MSDIMEQQRQHGEAQELAAKELMGGCIEAAVETADFSTTESGNWHSWLREEVVKALRERDAEIERLRKERNDILTAKEIVFQPPAIPESFVIQELQKANVALHADIARLRSGARCPHCDELRLDLGDARREIERLRASERSDWLAAVQRNDEITRIREELCARSAECRVKDAEIERLRDVIDRAATAWLALDPLVQWEGDLGNAMVAAVAEIERLRRITELSKEQNADLLEDLAELTAEIERLRGLLRQWRQAAEIAQDLTFAPVAKATDEALGEEPLR